MTGPRTHNYVITIVAKSQEEADRVMVERLIHDEDYGFPYTINYAPVRREPFPSDAVCSCGADDWLDTEHGYTRSSGAVYDQGAKVFTVHTNGWSDMSEDGTERCLTCGACWKEYAWPEGVEVDWV